MLLNCFLIFSYSQSRTSVVIMHGRRKGPIGLALFKETESALGWRIKFDRLPRNISPHEHGSVAPNHPSFVLHMCVYVQVHHSGHALVLRLMWVTTAISIFLPFDVEKPLGGSNGISWSWVSDLIGQVFLLRCFHFSMHRYLDLCRSYTSLALIKCKHRL